MVLQENDRLRKFMDSLETPTVKYLTIESGENSKLHLVNTSLKLNK